VAKYDGKLICWYPAAQGQGTIETAGIFDQVQDTALAPTFVMKINAEDGTTDDAKHGNEAQAAAQDYTAEGKTTKAKKTALVKDTLAWLVAKCKIQGEELSSQTQKRRMARAMTNILINDPVWSCEQRSKSHRIHHKHHCITIPYQFHDPFGSLHDSHAPFPHV
jgi:hypothetical protein